MAIDVNPISDFEQEYATVLDLLDQLKRLSSPTESEGATGIAKWFREFHQIMLTLTILPESDRLTRFAEELDMALSDKEASPIESPPPDDDILAMPDPFFYGEIVTDATGGEYTFKEKRLTDGTTWADAADGRTGTCYEVNDVAGTAVGAIIKIRIEYDTGGTLRYVFESPIPNGIIVMWGGAVGDIPGGWTLCDGGNDSKGSATPDLSSRFIVGYNPSQTSDPDIDTIGNTGGAWLHSHPVSVGYATKGLAAGDYSIAATVGTCTGRQKTYADCCAGNLDVPVPYYVLAFIRKD